MLVPIDSFLGFISKKSSFDKFPFSLGKYEVVQNRMTSSIRKAKVRQSTLVNGIVALTYYVDFLFDAQNTTMSGFSDWSAATSSGDVLDCAFSDLLDLYTTMYQVSGVYPRTSFAAWDASAFLQTAFAGSNVSYASLCQSPMASGVTVTVRVGCVAQFKLFSSISEFQWSNDTAADGVWQTIVFSCPGEFICQGFHF